jgi:uncharacterized protein
MTAPAQSSGGELRSSLPYVLPFAVFLAFLVLSARLPFEPRFEQPLRVLILAAVLYAFSRQVISFRLSNPLGSLLMGVGVFLIWIGPDVLIPGYREHWLFQNSVTGRLQSSLDDISLQDSSILAFRSIRAIILVPIIEELFWRAWLMRWLIQKDFQKLPLGAYAPAAFWITALLFASEHGPYWEVGLLAGIAYNWWMIRTKSLGDCILAHAVTNACLSGYVILYGKWEYWL